MEYQKALTRWARKLADRDPRMADMGFVRWDDDRPVTLEMRFDPGSGCDTCGWGAYTEVVLEVPFIGYHISYLSLRPRFDTSLEVQRRWDRTWNPEHDTFDFAEILGAILAEAAGA